MGLHAVFPCTPQGKPNPLLSSFRLSYYTLLNLLKRVEGGTDSLEYVIAHSFQQFQQEAARPRVRQQKRLAPHPSCCKACLATNLGQSCTC